MVVPRKDAEKKKKNADLIIKEYPELDEQENFRCVLFFFALMF